MRSLDRKLLRDAWNTKGQAIAIALVIGAGVTMFIMYLSTFDSLRLTQQSYYERFRFADVFASLKRAPLRIRERVANVPGVNQVETRVVADVNLDVPGFDEPVTGRLISIPDFGPIGLNDLFLRRGRFPETGRSDEVLVAESFALAHQLQPGDSVSATINARKRRLDIVGVALSPEYVYSLREGQLLPDDKRFGVFWMRRNELAAAFDMEGAFNSLLAKLAPGASADEAIDHIDQILRPYGGLGAIPRDDQISTWSVNNELTQLQQVGYFIPFIFLGVAAFLLNVVLSRIVAVQREQVAALKALGYSNWEIALHYSKWSVLVGLLGTAIGVAGGTWMGSGMINLYNDLFRFPILTYELSDGVVVRSILISLAASLLGAFSAVRRAAGLPPAEAMRPEPPAIYRQSWIERLGLKRFLSQGSRMILRNLQRRPVRSLISVMGIAFATALLVVGTFFLDALDVLLGVQFNVVERQDISVYFNEPASAAALHEISRLPGAVQAQPVRSVAARLRHGHRSRLAGITGLSNDAQLSRAMDASLQRIQLPPEGIVMSSKLAELLGVERGDEIIVEVLEGSRPVRRVPVANLVEQYLGLPVYMEIDALHAMMREGGNLSGVFLRVDDARLQSLYRILKAIPAVAEVSLQSAAVESFNETIGENLGLMIFFNAIFGGVIAFGVVYNAARISLSERSRELASLRVLGFTRAEISSILLGELAVLTVVGIPIGLLIGYGLAALSVSAWETELYRFPLIVTARTNAYSALLVAVASLVSGLAVRRRLDRLDLIAVLKSRE